MIIILKVFFWVLFILSIYYSFKKDYNKAFYLIVLGLMVQVSAFMNDVLLLMKSNIRLTEVFAELLSKLS